MKEFVKFFKEQPAIRELRVMFFLTVTASVAVMILIATVALIAIVAVVGIMTFLFLIGAIGVIEVYATWRFLKRYWNGLFRF